MDFKQQAPEPKAASVLHLSERIYQGEGVAIYLTTRPVESSDDLVFASVDATFRGGPLPTLVSEQTGIPLPDEPPEGRGFLLIPNEKGHQSLALIQTMGTNLSPADALADNLRAFCYDHGLNVERIWCPVMGTGSAGLSYQDAGAIICEQLLYARAELPSSTPLTIDLAPPPDTGQEDIWRIADHLRRYLLKRFPPVGGDPVAAETRNLLDRVIYAQLTYPDRTIDFELTEVHWPISEDTVLITKSGLEASAALQEFHASFGSDTETDPNRTVIDLSNQIFAFKNGHLVNLTMSRSKSHQKPEETVYIPVEAPESKAEIAHIVGFINNSVEFRDYERLSFRLVFDEPLSAAIHRDLREEVNRIIEKRGGTYQGQSTASTTASNEMPAQFHSDHALTHPDQDELGRDAIAGAIATNVARVWDAQMEASRPFAVHLSGRWGSGKSSILTFLKAHLENDKRFPLEASPGTIYKVKKKGWVVVDYNAWKMQEAGPPWWSLLTTVKEEGYKALGTDGYYPRMADWLWEKSRIAKAWIWTLGIVVALILAYRWLDVASLIPVKGSEDEASPVAFVLAVIAVLVPIGTLAGMVQSWSKSATETAEAVRNLQSDPTAVVKDRYSRVIECIDRPVAVFIDDLDRCEAQFVVDLLQSLQTAYAQVPVLYVVAADRNWIVSAYNQVYKDFKEEISKPGAPLGYLFVKKIFQLSVPVPDLGTSDSTKLAEVLLKTETAPEPPTKTVAERERAIDVAAAEGDVEEVTRIVSEGASEGQVLGGKAIEAVTKPENQQKLRHQLLEYTHLFDANPRAIKRLINALTFRQGYAASSGAYPGFDVMARWTILSLRFPYSADLLCETPSRIDEVFAGPPGKDEVEFPNRAEAAHILEGLTKDDIEKVAAFG